MHGDRFWRMPGLPAARRGLIVRMLLALLTTLVSVTFALVVLIGVHTNVHAATTIYEAGVPASDPWGLAFDNSGNILVAVPQCDPTPVCNTVVTGSIVEYTRQGFSNSSTPSQVFKEPAK